MNILDFTLISIGEAAKHYGVSVVTMRRWDKQGKLTSHSRTIGNHRRYKVSHNKRLRIYPSDLKMQIQSLGRKSGQGTIRREWHSLFKCCNAALSFCLSSLRAGFKSSTTALFVLDIERLCLNTNALYLKI